MLVGQGNFCPAGILSKEIDGSLTDEVASNFLANRCNNSNDWFFSSSL
jgi:hypothetical protein